MSDKNNARRPNKRKRKSFMVNARKYGKKGCYGRGTELDADTYQYFVQILEAYRAGIESEEEKLLFASNVFKHTVDNEVHYACNQVGCRVIDTLLPLADAATLTRFMIAFGVDLRPLCHDVYASHALEALVKRTAHISLGRTNDSAEFQAECTQFTVKLSKYLLNNLEDYVWDSYGNYVIRTCLKCLTQLPIVDEDGTTTKKIIQIKEEEIELPDEYVAIVREYGERLISWPQFGELCTVELTSASLQVLLRCLAKVDQKLLKRYLKKLLNDHFLPPAQSGDNDDLTRQLPVFLSKALLMLLETALQLANASLYTKIYTKCFANRLIKQSITRNTHYAVQKLINSCSDKSEFEAIFEELKDGFKEIIKQGHTSIILALAQGCKKFHTKQAMFQQELMKSLDCYELEDGEQKHQFVQCLVRFISFSQIKSLKSDLQKDKLNLNGTLIMELLLEFNKPIKIVKMILAMDAGDLKDFFSNMKGSHIVDSYMKSEFVGEKSRENLIRKMKGHYQDLAMTKYGSRSFDALWDAANLKCRLAIMNELAYKDGAWSNSDYGRIIAGKVNLMLYKRNKDDWQNFIVNKKSAYDKTTKDNIKEVFADILK